MPTFIHDNIPHDDATIHLWCMYSAILFIVISLLTHLLSGNWAKYGALIAIKQGITGLSFPYSVILMFVYAETSLMQNITDIPKYLIIAGLTVAIVSLAGLFKIG
jgi:hypothetical protein